MRQALRTSSLLVTGATALVLSTGLTTALAQSEPSLAEIAEREIARRKAIGTPSKVYTNDDLKHTRPLTMAAARTAPAAPAESAATPATSAAPPAVASQVDALAARLVAARDALTRTRADFDAQQSRVSALTADWVGAPDEATRASVAAARDAAAVEAERLRADIDAQVKALAQLEQDVLKVARPVPPPR